MDAASLALGVATGRHNAPDEAGEARRAALEYINHIGIRHELREVLHAVVDEVFDLLYYQKRVEEAYSGAIAIYERQKVSAA